MASIRKLKRGRKRWQVRWIDGGVEASETCATAGAARKLLTLVQHCEDIGVRYDPEPERPGVPSLGEAMSAFILDLPTSKKANTIARYESAVGIFADFLDETIGAVATVDMLSREMLASFYRWLEFGRWNRRRSLATKRRIVEKIEGAWDWLDETGWSPAVPRARTIEMARGRKKDQPAPTFAEMGACVLACMSEGPRRVATILYYLGVRAEQARTLTWDAVDMDRGLITIDPHKVDGDVGRTVPMSAHLLAELGTWGVRTGLLCGWGAHHTIAERRLNEAWARAGVREAVWKRAPSQAFRRGLVTGLTVLGALEESAEFYVGHAIKGVRRHYVDGEQLPLRAIAALIPRIGATNVVALKVQGET